jgi:selenocysteine lyase/cysteine desulfurase
VSLAHSTIDLINAKYIAELPSRYCLQLKGIFNISYHTKFIITNKKNSHLSPCVGNTHTDDSYVGSKTTCAVQKASSYIKWCMGAGPDDVLLFCGSGSSGAIKHLQEVMGITVPSILRDRVVQMLTEGERWVVFTGPYEHHSNLLSWRNSTAEVVEIGLDKNGLIDLEELRCQLMSPEYANRPMLGSFSACSNVTGIISDTRAITRLLHEHGAFACFDFAAR